MSTDSDSADSTTEYAETTPRTGIARCAPLDGQTAPYTVHGVAIGPNDVTNGANGLKIWPPETLQEAAETLEGVPLNKNHDSKRVESVVGEVVAAEYDPDVAEIFETALDPSILTAFFKDAHRIVEQRCGPYTDDEDALATVETYLAAHLATAKDPRVSQGSHKGIQVTYGASGERYWHKAVLIDPTNRLARPGGYAIFST